MASGVLAHSTASISVLPSRHTSSLAACIRPGRQQGLRHSIETDGTRLKSATALRARVPQRWMPAMITGPEARPITYCQQQHDEHSSAPKSFGVAFYRESQ